MTPARRSGDSTRIGIIDRNRDGGNKEASQALDTLDADTIVAATVVGFVAKSGLLGIPLRIVYEDDPKSPGAAQSAHEKVCAALELLLRHPYKPTIEAVPAPKFSAFKDEGADSNRAITGLRGGAGAPKSKPMSHRAREFALDLQGSTQGVQVERSGRTFVGPYNKDEDFYAGESSTERGAYCGIVDFGEDEEPFGPMSTTRRVISYSGATGANREGPRWNRGVVGHGLIGYERGE